MLFKVEETPKPEEFLVAEDGESETVETCTATRH